MSKISPDRIKNHPEFILKAQPSAGMAYFQVIRLKLKAEGKMLKLLERGADA